MSDVTVQRYRPAPSLPLPGWWPWPILALAFTAAVLGFFWAPSINCAVGPPQWFQPFFAAAAGSIAALFIALALGTIQISTGRSAAILTVAYVALGELAALAAISTELPAWLYKFLLAATVGAGVGALGSAVVLGSHAISDNTWQRRENRLAEILNRTLDDANEKSPLTKDE